MANPNTKIIIQEVDETLPKGSGVSSDIAYIPGLAVDSYEVEFIDKTGNKVTEVHKTIKNQPVLCYTVADLEKAFGSKPYQMTSQDIAKGDYAHTYEVGGYDRSYIYAKELLQSGLAVYYENIAPEEKAPVNIVEVNEAFEVAESSTFPIGPLSDLKSTGTNTWTYTACSEDAGKTQTYQFTFKLPIPEAKAEDANKKGSELTLAAGNIYINTILPQEDAKIIKFEIPNNNSAEEGGFDGLACTCRDDNCKFTIDKVDGKAGDFIIHWGTKGTASADDFRNTTFTLTLEVTPTADAKHGTEYPITIAGVEGVTLSNTPTFGRIQYFYEHLQDAILRLRDKNEYTVKYITSGGYPTFDIGKGTLYTTLLSIAGERGDAVALIDHLDNPQAPHGDDENSIFTKVNNLLANAENAQYGAMFTPWAKYAFATVTDNEDCPAWMPASFGYLMCMAKAIATSPNWLAMAGVSRGAVPNLQELHVDRILSNTVAEDYQPKYGTGKNVSINCITNIKPYGLCIWGNRTLYPMAEKGAIASNFLNTRNMCSDIKKVAYSTAKALMFEQDSDTLWLRFKAGVGPLLDQLKSGYGISDYKLIRGTTKYNGQSLTRGEMAAVIKIYPIAPIEYFEITVVMADEDVQIS